MDNISIARLLDETASLLEIDGADPFRVRSYRRAAEAVEQQTTQLSTLMDEPKRLLDIPGIGKGMAANIVALLATGTLPLREKLLLKYKPTMLDLLRLPGMRRTDAPGLGRTNPDVRRNVPVLQRLLTPKISRRRQPTETRLITTTEQCHPEECHLERMSS